jgi:hypothetical protein
VTAFRRPGALQALDESRYRKKLDPAFCERALAAIAFYLQCSPFTLMVKKPEIMLDALPTKTLIERGIG